MPSPTEEARALARSTKLTQPKVTIKSTPSARDQPALVSVSFSVKGGLVEAYNRETWQRAYAKHDTLLRLTYSVGIYRKGAGSLWRAAVRPIKFVRKGKLYWTRNPDLSDNVTNRIWSFSVGEDDRPKIFDSERELRSSLFDFKREVEIQPSSLKAGKNSISARVSLSWARHTYIEKGRVTSRSDPASVVVP